MLGVVLDHVRLEGVVVSVVVELHHVAALVLGEKGVHSGQGRGLATVLIAGGSRLRRTPAGGRSLAVAGIIGDLGSGLVLGNRRGGLGGRFCGGFFIASPAASEQQCTDHGGGTQGQNFLSVLHGSIIPPAR